jgi:hypothetical protein
MGSQVSMTSHVNESQHGGKVPTFELMNPLKYEPYWDLYYFTQKILGFVLQVGSSSLLNPTLNTSPMLALQKVLPCRHPCHTWALGFGAPCEVVSPNFHALCGWDCANWSQVNWDLGLGTPCELALKCIFLTPMNPMTYKYIQHDHMCETEP